MSNQNEPKSKCCGAKYHDCPMYGKDHCENCGLSRNATINGGKPFEPAEEKVVKFCGCCQKFFKVSELNKSCDQCGIKFIEKSEKKCHCGAVYGKNWFHSENECHDKAYDRPKSTPVEEWEKEFSVYYDASFDREGDIDQYGYEQMMNYLRSILSTERARIVESIRLDFMEEIIALKSKKDKEGWWIKEENGVEFLHRPSVDEMFNEIITMSGNKE